MTSLKLSSPRLSVEKSSDLPIPGQFEDSSFHDMQLDSRKEKA
jgi:hypothetical protein